MIGSPECFEYRLGNRSALEWALDQYQGTDARSGIISDPNRLSAEEYIVRLSGVQDYHGKHGDSAIYSESSKSSNNRGEAWGTCDCRRGSGSSMTCCQCKDSRIERDN